MELEQQEKKQPLILGGINPLELAVIGALWMDYPNDAALHSLKTEFFSDDLCKRSLIFITEMRKRTTKADLVVEWDRLGAELRVTIAKAIEVLPSVALLPEYVRALRQRHAERLVSKIVFESQGVFTDEDKAKIKDCLEESDALSSASWVSPKQALPGLLAYIEERRNKGPDMPTGYNRLDEMTDGYHKGELWTVGAYTNVGKTVCLTSMAHILMRRGKKVTYFTSEMNHREFMKERLLPAFSGVHAKALRSNRLTDYQMEQVREGAAKLADFPLTLIDQSFPSIGDIRSAIRTLKPEIVFVDYIHRCKLPKAENRNMALGLFMGELKTLARDFNIPIVAASQLSRQHQKDDTAPMLSDLRDSGNLEIESDVVLLLHRAQVRDPFDPTGKRTMPDSKVQALVAKNRHGEVGRFELEMDSSMLLLSEITPESEGDER